MERKGFAIRGGIHEFAVNRTAFADLRSPAHRANRCIAMREGVVTARPEKDVEIDILREIRPDRALSS
jgi:hypothetical protein